MVGSLEFEGIGEYRSNRVDLDNDDCSNTLFEILFFYECLYDGI